MAFMALTPPDIAESTSNPESPTARRIKRQGQELCDALRAVTDEIPAKSRSPQEFARTLKVHRLLVGRLLMAIRTADPLAAISRMPRSEGLRMILQAARPSVARATVDRAEAALSTFERIVHGELGGWDGFDAVITEWLPEAREKFELANKQAVFKGLSNLTGVRADVQLDTAIYYPDSSGQRCDIVLIEGLLNLRRLRPSVRVRVASHTPSPRAPQPLELLADQGGSDPANSSLLPQFCSSPRPRLEAVTSGDTVNYLLSGSEIGVDSAVDIVTANIVRGGRPLYREPGEPTKGKFYSAGTNVPAKTLLMNVLLHEDVWPGDPRLMMYNLHIRGVAEPDDPSRELDRVDLGESLQSLGTGAARFRATEVGRHAEIVQHVCERLNWDSNKLRGYRVRVQYPLSQVQFCIVFSPPPIRAAQRVF